MLDEGRYKVSVSHLVIDDNNDMFLEVKLGFPQSGTLMIPVGKQPIPPEDQLSLAVENSVNHYLYLKYGQEIADEFNDAMPDGWWMDYFHKSEYDDATGITIDRSGIAAAVEKWRSVYPE
jgi:hypothetical protein